MVYSWLPLQEESLHQQLCDELHPEKRLMAQLRKHGAATCCFRTTEGIRAEVQDDHRNRWVLRPVDTPKSKVGARAMSIELIDEILNFAPDFIVIKGAGSAIEERLRAEDLGLVVKLGGPVSPQLLLADILLSESASQDRQLQRWFGPPTVQLPKQVHPAFSSPQVATSDYEFDAVSVGRLVRRKRHRLLEPLLEQGLRVAIIGDGPLREDLQSRWSKYDNVYFFGTCSASEIRDIMLRSAVLVHTGTGEGIPRAVVEAMAVGLPIVGIAGELDDQFIRTDFGTLVPQDGLAAAVCDARVPEMRKRMSAASRRAFERSCSEPTFDAAAIRFARLIAVERTRACRAHRWRRDSPVVVGWVQLLIVVRRALANLRRRGFGRKIRRFSSMVQFIER